MAKKAVKQATKPPAPAFQAKQPVTPKPAGTGAPKPFVAAAAPTPAPAPTAPKSAAPPGPQPAKPSQPLAKPAEKPAAAPAPCSPAGPQPRLAAFSFEAPEAKQVLLCGDFNQWQPEKTPMKRNAGGRWETSIPLLPGRYHYKFVADGQWVHDPAAVENVPNEYGSLNSVLVIPG